MDLRRLQRLLKTLNPKGRAVVFFSTGADDAVTVEFARPARRRGRPRPPTQPELLETAAPEKRPDRYSLEYLRQRMRAAAKPVD